MIIARRLGQVYSFLIICILLNVAGHSVVYVHERMIFIDTIGTALAAIAYGPVHGAFVGILSNNISFLIFENNNTYLLYSIVHLALAVAWGLIPRVVRLHMFDFFSEKSSYKDLFTGITTMSLAGAVAAAIAASIIKEGIPYQTKCALKTLPSHYFELECIYRAYIQGFIGDTVITTFIISLLINMPDKLVSFAAAVFIITNTMPRRRVKLYDYRGGILSTNRWSITFIVTITFLVVLCYNFYNVIYFVDYSTYQNILLNQTAVIAIVLALSIAVILCKSPNQTVFSTSPSHLESNLHGERNNALEIAFEDACRLAILYYFVMYMIISFLGNNEANLLSENLTSAISVSVFIALLKYALLICCRMMQKNGRLPQI